MARELINVEAVDRSFGAVDVLKDINIKVNDGDRIGIVVFFFDCYTTVINTISEQKQDTGDIEFAPGKWSVWRGKCRNPNPHCTHEDPRSYPSKGSKN